MKTARKLISELPLNINDIARLALEATESLGELAEGMERREMLQMLRRVIAEGVRAVRAAENTVSFEVAVEKSVRQGRICALPRAGICGISQDACCESRAQLRCPCAA